MAAGVIVCQHHTGGLMMQGAQRNFARVDVGLVDGAGKERFHANQAVLRIQKQHGKTLMRFVRLMHLHVLRGQLRAAQIGALLQLLGHCAARQFHHGQQLGAFGAAAQAFDGFQLCGIG